MKDRLVLAGIATVTMLGMGSLSASAAPLGATPTQAQPQQGLLLKAHYDDYRPWWKRRHHYSYDSYAYRDRPWWWRNKFDRGHDRRADRRADRRDYRDDRSDRRRNRDW
jgi:hypothetical protein